MLLKGADNDLIKGLAEDFKPGGIISL